MERPSETGGYCYIPTEKTILPGKKIEIDNQSGVLREFEVKTDFYAVVKTKDEKYVSTPDGETVKNYDHLRVFDDFFDTEDMANEFSYRLHLRGCSEKACRWNDVKEEKKKEAIKEDEKDYGSLYKYFQQIHKP